RITRALRAALQARRARRRAADEGGDLVGYDPGRERRAEHRASELLRSCIGAQEWAMYRDLGFLRGWGGAGDAYAYLIYPHRPIVAYVPHTTALPHEYCRAFPDHSRPFGSPRLPASDDVRANSTALVRQHPGLIAGASTPRPGRQTDPDR